MNQNQLTFRQWYEINFSVPPPIYIESDRKKILRSMFHLFQAMERVSGNSSWAVSINTLVFRGGKIEEMCTMVSSLRSQAKDNPDMMKRILGPEYEAIVNCTAVPAPSWLKLSGK